MKIDSKEFRVTGKKVKLSEWPTIVKPVYKAKEQYQELLAEHVEKLSSLGAPSLRIQPLCVAADFSRDGRRRQGRRYPARHVRREPTRMRGFQLQTAERQRAGTQHTRNVSYA